jgi:hypothetical protein
LSASDAGVSMKSMRTHGNLCKGRKYRSEEWKSF